MSFLRQLWQANKKLSHHFGKLPLQSLPLHSRLCYIGTKNNYNDFFKIYPKSKNLCPFKPSTYLYLIKTVKMKHYFQIILLFILLPGICQNNLLALSGDSLGYEFRHATHDTARVKILFQSGNRFIDGPSDSLLFYYHRALHIIEKNIQIRK